MKVRETYKTLQCTVYQNIKNKNKILPLKLLTPQQQKNSQETYVKKSVSVDTKWQAGKERDDNVRVVK